MNITDVELATMFSSLPIEQQTAILAELRALLSASRLKSGIRAAKVGTVQ